MCGINGFFNYSGVRVESEERIVDKMNDSIAHRGPDDSGVWIDNTRQVSLGHRRLSILDLSPNGHQPMVDNNGNAIVFNGEIYNYRNLKKEIYAHNFFSESDTEVLLCLYNKHHHDALDRLNGMFAFAIWDQARCELFLARDRIGIKPLYYTTINGVFAFSSEIKSLLTLPWVHAKLDEEAFYDFLTFTKLNPPHTMFRDIYKFHPGYKMVVGKNGITLYDQYWEVEYTDYHALSEEELTNLILKEFQASIDFRMVSDVPVGAFLSGGVDSSAIVATMRKFSATTIKTYSVGFEGAPGYDELKFARKIAAQFNTDHYEKVVNRDDIAELLPKIVEIYDEPLVDATSIPIYFISQLARAEDTYVILTGDGPDELFAGYRNWLPYVKLYPYYRCYSNIPELVKKLALKGYSLFDTSSPYFEMLNRAANNQEFFWGGARGFKSATKKSFLSDEYANRMKDVDSYRRIVYYQELFNDTNKNGRKMSDVDWLTFIGFKDLIPNFYLYRADRLGMANAVELRVPYLDHNFVSLALSIEGRWKIRNDEPKYIFKKALEQVLDTETLYRKKQGFCVPMQEWIQGTIIEYIENHLTPFCKETGLFNEQALITKIRAAKEGNKNYTNMLWTIYFLMSWFKKWLI